MRQEAVAGFQAGVGHDQQSAVHAPLGAASAVNSHLEFPSRMVVEEPARLGCGPALSVTQVAWKHPVCSLSTGNAVT